MNLNDKKRANDYDEVKLLIDICKTGKLFDVQNWIAEGKPVNLPSIMEGKTRRKSPLEVAIDSGFHSLVQVLLEGGAIIKDKKYNALLHAVNNKRLDLVDLLIQHGADLKSITMGNVFDTWNKEIIEYFIQIGADLETNNPLAYALCSRIYPALAISKTYQDRFPSFKEQVNIALRHHCKEGNIKWVSLMLWAGGDPYVKGPDSPHNSYPESFASAVELAALYERFDLFKLKFIKLKASHPSAGDIMHSACLNKKSDLLNMLLDHGFNPRKLGDKGSSLIQTLLSVMSWGLPSFPGFTFQKENIDSDKSREKIKMLHILVRHGARWEPDQYGLKDARRCLLKLTTDYTMEFIWLMSEYKACSPEAVKGLVHTPKMQAFLTEYTMRLKELIKAF